MDILPGKPPSDQMPGRFSVNGQPKPAPVVIPVVGADPVPPGKALPVAVMVQLGASLVLLTVSLVQVFVILPALTGGWRELANERRQHQKADDTAREFDRLMEETRRSAVVQQAQLVATQQEAKKVADENLRLAEQLNKRLKEKTGPDR